MVQEIGEHELRYTRGGVVRRGQSNLSSVTERLGRRIGDSKKLMALAQRRETWRRLAELL